MSETRVLLDPTSEQKPAQRERVDRPDSLEGLTIGLLDISKKPGRCVFGSGGIPFDRPGFDRKALSEADFYAACSC